MQSPYPGMSREAQVALARSPALRQFARAVLGPPDTGIRHEAHQPSLRRSESAAQTGSIVGNRGSIAKV